MTEKAHIKLIKASDEATSSNVQHLVLMVMPDGRMKFNGSANMVSAIYGNKNLYEQVQTSMCEGVVAENKVVPVQVIDFPLLPCSPFSPNWKKGPMIRGVLTKMRSNQVKVDHI